MRGADGLSHPGLTSMQAIVAERASTAASLWRREF
jgi:hypothetical protein